MRSTMRVSPPLIYPGTDTADYKASRLVMQSSHHVHETEWMPWGIIKPLYLHFAF